MSRRSCGLMGGAWRIPTRKQKARARAKRKHSRQQRRHLEAIKSPAELRRIVLGGRHLL